MSLNDIVQWIVIGAIIAWLVAQRWALNKSGESICTAFNTLAESLEKHHHGLPPLGGTMSGPSNIKLPAKKED